MKNILPIVALLTLAACSSWTKSAEVVPAAANIKLPAIPQSLASCPAVVSVQGQIGNAETVGERKTLELWARDRAAAAQCRNRLIGLVAFYEEVRAETDRMLKP